MNSCQSVYYLWVMVTCIFCSLEVFVSRVQAIFWGKIFLDRTNVIKCHRVTGLSHSILEALGAEKLGAIFEKKWTKCVVFFLFFFLWMSGCLLQNSFRFFCPVSHSLFCYTKLQNYRQMFSKISRSILAI